MTDPTVVNVGYRSTNYWIISAGNSRLLFDIGWPGTMGWMQANLDRMDVPINEIRYAVVSHYHIDHAGLAEEFKQAGVPLLLLDVQTDAIPIMKRWTKPQDTYIELAMGGNTTTSFAETRTLLEEIGIIGEIVHTPGHSEDSISLLLDNGSAFTGDLTAPGMVTEEQAEEVATSWQTLWELGARKIYPGHGPVWKLTEDIRR